MAEKFGRRKEDNAVVVADQGTVRFACVSARGAKPFISHYREISLGDGREGLVAAMKTLGVAGVRNGMTLLAPQDYQFVAVDAPEVPEAELKAAMKWRLKDIIGYPIEEATFDLLSIPSPPAGGGRARSLFSVVAKSEVLRSRVADFDHASFRLAVIDVPETAQRNIAALFEEEGRGVASLYFDEAGGLLIISYRGELYHSRRFDITSDAIAAAAGSDRDDLFNRVLLELQRTIDNFERQFSFIALTKILVGPDPVDSGLAEFLRSNLAVTVEDVSLEKVFDFRRDALPGREAQWRFFHLFGCALRGPAEPQ